MVSGRTVNFMVKENFFLRMGHIIWGLLFKVLRMVRDGIVIIMVVCMKGIYRTMKPMDWEFITIHSKDMNTTVNGKMMSHMVKEKKSSKMAHIIKENSFMESNQEWVIMFVILGFIRDNF